MEYINKIINEECLTGLKKLPDNSIDCCVTSPPYYGLRDYGHEGQIGLEETPEAYVNKLVDVFTEVKRVLKKEGSLWLNLGDSYWGGKGQSGSRGADIQEERHIKGESINRNYQTLGGLKETRPTDRKHEIIKPKDLIGIPWMVAFALRSSGWYLRQDLIWHKPNPMPESVTDRCTKAHEYIFLLSKSVKYYYDAEAINELAAYDGRKDTLNKGSIKYAAIGNNTFINRERWRLNNEGEQIRNKRSVWTVTTKPFTEAHFATFPEDLIVDMIKAGCPEEVCNKCGKAREKIFQKTGNIVMEHGSRKMDIAVNRHEKRESMKVQEKIIIAQSDCNCNAGFSPGIVLDPFSGAGTTAVVAKKLNRNYVGFELNEEYINISNKRLYKEIGMFL